MNLRHVLRRHSLLHLVAMAPFAITLLGGLVIAAFDSDTLQLDEWLALLTLSAIPAAIAAVGEGLHLAGREEAGARALEIAHLNGGRYSEPQRNFDPATIPTPDELDDSDARDRYDPGA